MCIQFLVLFLFIFFSQTCKSQDANLQCPPSSCGKIRNISYPFRLQTGPNNCAGRRWHDLFCQNNVTILNLYSGRYIVESINYNNYTLRIVDSGVKKDNCSSLPRRSLSGYNFSYYDPFRTRTDVLTYGSWSLTKSVIFMSCENPAESPLYIDASYCLSNSFSPSSRNYSYALIDGSLSVFDMPSSCRVELMSLVSRMAKINGSNTTFGDIHDALVQGFELSWTPDRPINPPKGLWDRFLDFIRGVTTLQILFVLSVIGFGLVGRFILGSPFVIIFLIYKWRRRHISMYDRIEEFLQSYNNLVPIRYSYSEIKKMTSGFRDKLGEGGYGSVYKGKLRSDRLVAIKMLGGTKGNGEDFINEVATIGRIHHVNVVQLIGFCVEGSKRALVYDYMPKGSLDKHIFSGEGIERLSSEKMFQISLGVARGIEYLHRGCEIQILHFDIKPHNILLDDNFVPKVSDFGLARLCPLDHNTVTLTAARGTLGYIAPELFYKNIGGVSYKADVYSFGMLLMEMASRRKNVNSAAENSSKVHFPTWVSNRFSEGNDVDLGVTTAEESKLVKKMMIVALWCIQFKPTDRPSMSKVVEMLESESEFLEMPPTKFSFYPQQELSEDLGDGSFAGESSSSMWSYSSSIQSGNSSTTHNSLIPNKS